MLVVGLLVLIMIVQIAGWDYRRRARKRVVRYFEPLPDRELREVLAVEDDEPLLRAVVHVLHSHGLRLAEQAGAVGLAAEESKGLAMASVAVEDACDDLLEQVERARKLRAGVDDT